MQKDVGAAIKGGNACSGDSYLRKVVSCRGTVLTTHITELPCLYQWLP